MSTRVRSVVLAGAIALGGMAPAVLPASADGPDDGPEGGVPVETAGAFDVVFDSVAELSGMTAVVAGGGDRVNLRAEPSFDGDVVALLDDGTTVDLRIDRLDTVYDPDGVTRWWPVSAGGVDGWVSGFHLEDAEANADADATPVQFTLDGEGLTGRTAVVAGGGDGINLRAAPSRDADIRNVLAGGTVVDLRIDRADTVVDADGVTRWWPVAVAGEEGWISGFYLVDPEEAGTAAQPAARQELAYDGEGLAGRTAVVSGGGDGVNLRNAPAEDAGIVTVLADQTVVNLQIDILDTVVDENATRWWPVEVGGTAGWIAGFYLAEGGNESAERVATTLPAEAAAPEAAPDEVDGTAELGMSEPPAEPEADVAPEVDAVPEVDVEEQPAPEVPEQPETEEPEEPQAPEVEEPQAPEVEEPEVEEPEVEEPEVEEPEVPAPPTVEAEPEPAPTGPTGTFIYPVNGRITQGFGCSDLPFYDYDPNFGCAVHRGLDIAAPSYTPIVAADGGTVVFAGNANTGRGNYVEIDHGNGVHTFYHHMAEQPYVSVGEQVSKGQLIGPVGSTGSSTGPHVHFAVQIDGVFQDPQDYL